MLAVGKCGFSWSYSLQSAPSTTPGVSVTPGSGSKGAYVQLASGANLSQDCYGLLLWFVAGNTTATIRDILADIGLDPAGGTSYAQTGGINNIFVPQIGNAIQSGRWFYFPLFIKAGTSVGVRGQANNTSTFRCMARFYGQPTKPENIAVGMYSETIGVSGNGGTPFTCGNSAAWASWTSLGTTTRPLWYWQLAWGHNVGTTTAQMYFAELGVGDGTTGGTVTIIPCMPMFNPGTAEQSNNPLFDGYWEVPAGATLYVRGSATGTAETTEAVAVGIGG
ncbi:MAG TPA: hypothetical protein VLH56_02480 [Dissulfurispiraceae bacterium]|nr:hypothetical protein [Dissulfurispiraceae bacterium]